MVKLNESHPNSWHRLSPIEYWMKMQRLWLTRTKKSVPHNIGSQKHLKETLNITSYKYTWCGHICFFLIIDSHTWSKPNMEDQEDDAFA